MHREWQSCRFRLHICTPRTAHDAPLWGVRVDKLADSRSLPTPGLLHRCRARRVWRVRVQVRARPSQPRKARARGTTTTRAQAQAGAKVEARGVGLAGLAPRVQLGGRGRRGAVLQAGPVALFRREAARGAPRPPEQLMCALVGVAVVGVVVRRARLIVSEGVAR